MLLFLHKFWSPVPWMLEATLILELAIGKYTQTIIITFLLVLNAVLSFVQESRASNALAGRVNVSPLWCVFCETGGGS